MVGTSVVDPERIARIVDELLNLSRKSRPRCRDESKFPTIFVEPCRAHWQTVTDLRHRSLYAVGAEPAQHSVRRLARVFLRALYAD